MLHLRISSLFIYFWSCGVWNK